MSGQTILSLDGDVTIGGSSNQPVSDCIGCCCIPADDFVEANLRLMANDERQLGMIGETCPRWNRLYWIVKHYGPTSIFSTTDLKCLQ
ncbi:hypothetical protein PoB_006575200 [Plakobranchus ocellatus]|uniref:Uncharacterized protein n=1 Tax=Plakobranchus ocellatus TaxID=259542 RepID=A0AAV4D532_9GAST|nr:hypothetical protein PoB_006575200 [Plakobranchus ocellatus]